MVDQVVRWTNDFTMTILFWFYQEQRPALIEFAAHSTKRNYPLRIMQNVLVFSKQLFTKLYNMGRHFDDLTEKASTNYFEKVFDPA